MVEHPAKRRHNASNNNANIHQLLSILQAEDPHSILTTQALPKPITRSPKRTRAEPPPQAVDPNTLVSLVDKYALGGYNGPSALDELQSDLKTTTQAVIAKLSPTSELYAKVDKFYYYAESVFGRLVPVGKDDGKPEAEDESIRPRGADKEVLYMVSQHGPLFSSLSRKSRIDPREFQVPSFFNTTKIVPLRPSTVTSRKLGVLSPSPYAAVTGSAPAVAANLRPLLADFTHPVNEQLPTAKWLRYDAYSSFAPSRDEAHVVVSARTAAAVWYDRVRRKRAKKEPEGEREEEEEEKASEKEEGKKEDGEEKPIEEKAIEEAEIDPALIEEWLESDASKEYENTIIENITAWISRLQELQTQRFSTPPPVAPLVIPSHVFQNPQQLMQMQLQQAQQQQYFIEGPPVSEEETQLALQIQSALSEIVSRIPPYLISDLVSGWIPTLAKSTSGSLPPDATELPAVPAPSSGRRRR